MKSAETPLSKEGKHGTRMIPLEPIRKLAKMVTDKIHGQVYVIGSQAENFAAAQQLNQDSVMIPQTSDLDVCVVGVPYIGRIAVDLITSGLQEYVVPFNAKGGVEICVLAKDGNQDNEMHAKIRQAIAERGVLVKVEDKKMHKDK